MQDIGYAECLLKMLSHSNNEKEFIHAFQLASAYTPEMMPYTNYTYDFKGIIDYIFYPRQSMKPLGILGPISEEWLKEGKIIGCPHPHIPSGATISSLTISCNLTFQTTSPCWWS